MSLALLINIQIARLDSARLATSSIRLRRMNASAELADNPSFAKATADKGAMTKQAGLILFRWSLDDHDVGVEGAGFGVGDVASHDN